MFDEYPSTTLTLVRRGQARAADGSYGPDTPLSGLGRLQTAALTECDIGSRPLEAFQQRWDLAVWRPEHRGIEGSQTLAQFSSLVAAFCDEIAGRHLGQRVLAFAHAGTIDTVIRWSLGISPASPWQHEFRVLNASVTELEFWPGGRIRGGAPRYAALYRIGDAAHLGGLASEL